jgi:serine/threonine-protein kinase
MPGDSQIQRLLEEILETDRTPEDVCQACPELLPQIRDRLRRLRALEAEVDAYFPTSGFASTHLQPPDGRPPQIPGYTVQSTLGRGGMGIVYRAKHLRLNRIVALKTLLAGAYAGPRERERFQREAEAVASLRHPNIVQIYDVGDHDGRPFFTMELLEGGSLAQALAGTPQPAQRAAALVATLAGAVQVAHLAGIVHRDLKPANVLLTSDGTPKVVDFGLARHFDGESAVSLSGARVGTPSYMAPEQVLGRPGAIGASADIYALGAVLYEMLTGRPPFRAETSTETELQVIGTEPVAPARLNPRVPRDLETICLKCLNKDMQRRYASAAALAEDLRRFEDGRPIQARRLSKGERSWRWVRRNPALAGLIVMALTLAGLALGGGFWMERQWADRRAEKARQEGRASLAAEAALDKAAALEKEGRWSEARAALEGAEGLLDASAPGGLVERLRQARLDTDMVADLEEIRLRQSERESRERLESAPFSPAEMYANAFRKYGIPVLTFPPASAAEQVRKSPIHNTLLAFMHDWLRFESDDNRARIRAVLDRADDDDWRYAYREALAENNAAKFSALARAPEAPAQPAAVVTGLASAMIGNMYKYEAQMFMREAQQRHPSDFWMNYLLGCFWWEDYPREAVGYFRAAVAIRRTSEGPHLMLGRALRGVGDFDGAAAAFRRSAALSPDYIVAKELVWELAPRGELEQARVVWEKFLERDPPQFAPWYGYAALCLFVGNTDAYIRARKALLARFGETSDDWVVAERASLACLLLPDSGDALRRAIELADRAVAAGEKSSEPGNPYLRFVKGLALYRDGRPEAAVPLLRAAAENLHDRAGPPLALAMAQFQSGSAIEARKTLAAAVRGYNWKDPRAPSGADESALWISHVLRREAEATVIPNLQAFLRGDYQPQDNDERVALLGICHSQGRFRAAAQLYADAFAAVPGLDESMTQACLQHATQRDTWAADSIASFNAPCRYLAARCAAAAGCGLGKDENKVDEPQRARWRKQAREWLRADLAMWTAKLAGDSPLERNLARRMLTHWQTDPDLAGIRELTALDELKANERTDCFAFWHDVRAALKRTGGHPEVAALDPKPLDSQRPSPTVLLRLGRLNDARVAWKSALEANPFEHDAWYGYAELCLFLGDVDGYRDARKALLERFGSTTDPYVAERTSRACLLIPATGEELRQAAAIADRAVPGNSGDHWAGPYFEFARGFAEYRQGRFDGAITAMRGNASGVLGPCPALVVAMALHQKGQTHQARKTLASAILSYDWSARQVRDQHSCISHSLRREAEAMILPNLPAFLAGTYQPQDNDERLCLLGVCQFTNRTCAAARLYSDAFAAEPQLAADLGAAHRASAARAAALAGSGVGMDGSTLDIAERATWRRQARDWLRADLAACAKLLANKAEASRARGRQLLANWKIDPDLAGLREPRALETFSTDERNDCLALWKAVDELLMHARSAN